MMLFSARRRSCIMSWLTLRIPAQIIILIHFSSNEQNASNHAGCDDDDDDDDEEDNDLKFTF